MKRAGALLGLCMLLAAPAAASDIRVHGIGTKSCASFVYTLKSLKNEIEFNRREISQYLGWLNGYLTGAGHVVDTGPLKGLSGNEKLAWLRDYCGEHPEDPFYLAAAHLLDAYIKD